MEVVVSAVASRPPTVLVPYIAGNNCISKHVISMKVCHETNGFRLDGAQLYQVCASATKAIF